MLDRTRAPVQDNFYESPEWLRLRYAVLKKHGACCQCCGQRATANNPIQVDHIKPRSIFPGLALDINNLQVLCRSCNMGKSNRDLTDWRWAELPEVEVLNAADKETLARLQQLAWLKKNGDNKQIRMEAYREYRKLWNQVDLGAGHWGRQ